MILPLAALAAVAAWRWMSQRTGTWTPERRAEFWYLNTIERRPDVLTRAAARFALMGFQSEAQALRNRVAKPTAAGERGAARIAGDVFRQALQSPRASAVRDVATEFERLGMGASADQLRGWARGLEVLNEVDVDQPGFGIGVVIPSQYPVVQQPGLQPPPDAASLDASFGIGTVIPSQYATPQPYSAPPPPPPPVDPYAAPLQDPTQDPNAPAPGQNP